MAGCGCASPIAANYRRPTYAPRAKSGACTVEQEVATCYQEIGCSPVVLRYVQGEVAPIHSICFGRVAGAIGCINPDSVALPSTACWKAGDGFGMCGGDLGCFGSEFEGQKFTVGAIATAGTLPLTPTPKSIAADLDSPICFTQQLNIAGCPTNEASTSPMAIRYWENNLVLDGAVYYFDGLSESRRDWGLTYTSGYSIVSSTEDLFRVGDRLCSAALDGTATVLRVWTGSDRCGETQYYAELDMPATTSGCLATKIEHGISSPLVFEKRGFCYDVYLRKLPTLIGEKVSLSCGESVYSAGRFNIFGTSMAVNNGKTEIRRVQLASGELQVVPTFAGLYGCQ
jgi:hypothetical protein